MLKKQRQKNAFQNKIAGSGNEAAVEIKSLAVAPFRFLTGKTEADSGGKTQLGIGLADALTIRLYKVGGLSIRPSSLVLKIAEQTDDPFLLGDKLAVDYVLDGHILQSGERTRFSVQLLDVKKRSVLWASQFDENEDDIFRLEDSISAKIVESLAPRFDLEELPDKPQFAKAVINNVTENASQRETNSAEAKTLLLSEARETEEQDKKRWIFALAAVAIVFCLIGFIWLRQSAEQSESRSKGARPAQKSLAILPFKNEGAADESLGIGLADALTGKLGAVHRLSMRPASAGRIVLKGEKTISEIGRLLGADYILRGKLQKAGDRIQVSAELVNSNDGAILWTERLDAQEADLFGVQNQIAERVLQNLEIEPSAAERKRVEKRYTANNLAYELYLVGRYQMATRSQENLERAIATFTQAKDKDSNFALAYVGLADAYALLRLYAVPAPPDSYVKARENAMIALSLDDELAEAHASLGYVKRYGERDLVGAEREFRRSIELNPSYATAHHWFALFLATGGRHDEAVREIKAAQQLDPRAPVTRSAAGLVYFFNRDYEQALAECRSALEIDPGFVPAHKTMRYVYQKTGNFKEALASYQKEYSYAGGAGEPGWLVLLAQTQAVGGLREEANASLNIALAADSVRNDPATFAEEIALAYVFLDDRDKAIAWLEKAEASGNHGFHSIAVEPRWDGIRSDPRFIKLLDKINRSESR